MSTGIVELARIVVEEGNPYSESPLPSFRIRLEGSEDHLHASDADQLAECMVDLVLRSAADRIRELAREKK